MLRNPRFQAVLLVGLGSALGYAAAVGHRDASRSAEAAREWMTES